ncbi:hypothetical protein [Ramlibacter albus]|uniref:Uncharacterized protein n=1 Tax=Ramlibacter albus TaxID=2079448 RepID=A0A923M911_9BURK|nr:hypothetical protein [Ramlibacter albus]MBC5766038.1 hypothetical protein [Ramlibacter albus]
MCAPCNHQCQQGRTCPVRARQAAAQGEPVTFMQVRKELGDAMERLRAGYRRLRHSAPQH